jgi:hypothetical protein
VGYLIPEGGGEGDESGVPARGGCRRNCAMPPIPITPSYPHPVPLSSVPLAPPPFSYLILTLPRPG